MSEEKKTNIEQEVSDLDYVIRVLDHLERKHEQMYLDNRRLMEDALRYKRQVEELTSLQKDEQREKEMQKLP